MSLLYEKTKANFIKYGVHRVNRFMVTIPLPKEVASFVESQEELNGGLLPKWAQSTLDFSMVALGMNSNGDRSLQFMCRATELPGTQFSTESTDCNGHTFKYVTGIEREGLSFTFQLSSDMNEKTIMDKWKSITVNETSRIVGYVDDYSVDIEITALNERDQPVYTLIALDAYPATINSISLNKMAGDMASVLETNWVFNRIAPQNANDESETFLPGSLGGIVEGIKNGDLDQAAYSARMLLMQAKNGDFTGEAAALYAKINSVIKGTVGFSGSEIEKAVGKLSTMVNKSTSISSQERNLLDSLLKGLK